MSPLAEVLAAVAQGTALPILVGHRLGVRQGLPSSWYFGALVMGGLLILGHGLQIPQWLTFAAVLLVATEAVIYALRTRRQTLPLSVAERCALAAVALLLAVPAASAIVQTLHDPVPDSDALVIWYAKARALYHWTPLPYLPLKNYPEMGPALWMPTLKWVGLEQESIGRTIFPILYFAWIASLIDVFPRPYSFASVIALAFVGMQVFDMHPFTNGYQDGFVLVAAGFASGNIVRMLLTLPATSEGALDALRAANRELMRAGFLTGALALVKQEGTVWSLLIGGAFGLVLLLSTRPSLWLQLVRALLPFIAVWVATLALWPLLLMANQIDVRAVQGDGFTASSILAAFSASARWAVIEPYARQHFEAYRHLITVCVVGTVINAALIPQTRRAVALLWIVIVLHFAFLMLVFFSTRYDLAWHLATAFGRLSFQEGFGFVLLAFLLLAGPLKLVADSVYAMARPRTTSADRGATAQTT